MFPGRPRLSIKGETAPYILSIPRTMCSMPSRWSKWHRVITTQLTRMVRASSLLQFQALEMPATIPPVNRILSLPSSWSIRRAGIVTGSLLSFITREQAASISAGGVSMRESILCSLRAPVWDRVAISWLPLMPHLRPRLMEEPMSSENTTGNCQTGVSC